jgi:hypothetical protein
MGVLIRGSLSNLTYDWNASLLVQVLQQVSDDGASCHSMHMDTELHRFLPAHCSRCMQGCLVFGQLVYQKRFLDFRHEPRCGGQEVCDWPAGHMGERGWMKETSPRV